MDRICAAAPPNPGFGGRGGVFFGVNADFAVHLRRQEQGTYLEAHLARERASIGKRRGIIDTCKSELTKLKLLWTRHGRTNLSRR
jgi:hypothetical protein